MSKFDFLACFWFLEGNAPRFPLGHTNLTVLFNAFSQTWRRITMQTCHCYHSKFDSPLPLQVPASGKKSFL